jgi:hypothetical protein
MINEAKTRSIISWLFVLVPLFLMGVLLLANGRYMLPLFALQAPWIFVGLLPCGWIVLLGIVGLVLGARAVLNWADLVSVMVWQWLLRVTAIILVLVALVLVTIMPALFLIW